MTARSNERKYEDDNSDDDCDGIFCKKKIIRNQDNN